LLRAFVLHSKEFVMSSVVRFQVMLLPGRELLVSNCSLAEAVAFQRGYHEAMVAGEQRAVIAVDRPEIAAGSGPTLRHPYNVRPRLRSA